MEGHRLRKRGNPQHRALYRGPQAKPSVGFRSVAVITFASHAKGPRFETGRKQLPFYPQGLLLS